MKKLIFLIFISLMFISCEKNVPQPKEKSKNENERTGLKVEFDDNTYTPQEEDHCEGC